MWNEITAWGEWSFSLDGSSYLRTDVAGKPPFEYHPYPGQDTVRVQIDMDGNGSFNDAYVDIEAYKLIDWDLQGTGPTVVIQEWEWWYNYGY